MIVIVCTPFITEVYMMSCAVVGHSYLARLETSKYPCLEGVKFFCRLGATTRSILDSGILETVKESGVERIFLQVGGNDIKKSTRPTHVMKGITKIVDYLRGVPGVKYIVIGRLFRCYRPREVTYEQFEWIRTTVNNLLKLRYAMDPVVNVWTFRGLSDLAEDDFSDGVHLKPILESRYATSVSRSLRCVNFSV